jgi:hypothetical protein
LALKPTRPRENTSERVVFIKTRQFINPDIDYQDAAMRVAIIAGDHDPPWMTYVAVGAGK